MKIVWKIHARYLKGDYQRRKNMDVEKPLKTNIEKCFSVKRLQWTIHVWRTGRNLVRNVLVKNPKKNSHMRDCID